MKKLESLVRDEDMVGLSKYIKKKNIKSSAIKYNEDTTKLSINNKQTTITLEFNLNGYNFMVVREYNPLNLYDGLLFRTPAEERANYKLFVQEDNKILLNLVGSKYASEIYNVIYERHAKGVSIVSKLGSPSH